MTIGAAHLGTFGTAEANERASRELAAIGGAAEWLNSPRLTPKPRGESRARRLLDLHLHQLAAHASVCSRVGTEVPASSSS